MMDVAKQFCRVFSDDGSGDRDFSQQEERLRLAHEALFKATEDLRRAADTLTDLLQRDECPWDLHCHNTLGHDLDNPH